MNIQLQVISIQFQNEYLVVKTTKYDETLKESIKDSFPIPERKWEDNAWKVKNSPENLTSLREICQECASRRSWQFQDYTAETAKEIQIKKELLESELLEAHVTAVLEVLPKLPPHSLRLVRWGDKIKLQLARYLGEDEEGYKLFKELQRACTEIWKPTILWSLDHKMTFGFVFEMANDPRIINCLIELKGVEYLRIFSLIPVQIFPDGCAHLIDDSGAKFLGWNYNQVDMSVIDCDSKSWQLAKIDNTIYWVESFERYMLAWLQEDSFSVFFRAVISKSSKIQQILEEFHAHAWFQEWCLKLINNQELSPTTHGKFIQGEITPSYWQHPADSLISHQKRFNTDVIQRFSGLSPEKFEQKVLQIEELKKIKANSCREQYKQQAIQLVCQRLIHDKSKEELFKMAAKANAIVKKSWTKEKIVSAFVTQDYAETFLNLN